MQCPTCGNQLPDSARFCNQCGTRFEAQPQAAAPVPPAAPVARGAQTQQQAQHGYQQAPYNAPQQRPVVANDPYREPVETLTVGSWFVTILLLAIPIVGLIMLFVWGFGSKTPLPKRNFARAYLIWYIIIVVISIIVGIATGMSLNNMASYY